MLYAGADGDTRTEMARVLHFPEDETALHSSFEAFRRDLEKLTSKTAEMAEDAKRFGGPREPIILRVANGLFGQTGYDFRDSFLQLAKDRYGAGLEMLDFATDRRRSAKHINHWVEERTNGRIKDILPRELDARERLVLVNAIYLKAPWASEFPVKDTKPEPFHIRGGAPADVPTMREQRRYGYAKLDDFAAVSIPYVGDDLHFLILVPDDVKGLAALEAKLKPEILAKCASLKMAEVDLHLPRFKIEPPALDIRNTLETLGMKSAFNEPTGSANFDRLARRRVDDYLYISAILHKTFIAIDERGTEAAAATAVRMLAFAAPQEPPKPIEVKVDRPFFFAIQHRSSGACLFMGRVADPRASFTR
jgi:serpin B